MLKDSVATYLLCDGILVFILNFLLGILWERNF